MLQLPFGKCVGQPRFAAISPEIDLNKMDPRTFMRGLEEQLRRVKFQCHQIRESRLNSEVEWSELLDNARVWFLRTIQNTDLVYNEMHTPAVLYLMDESFAKQKSPPYNLMYPSILWIISTMPEERIGTLFGFQFQDRLKSISGQLGYRAEDREDMRRRKN